MRDTPWGAARFAYAYLDTVVAGLATALVAVIAYPVAVTPICRSDTRGYCASILTGFVVALVFVAALFVVAHLMNLGWQWAAWVVVLALVLIQIVVEANTPSVAWCALAIPAGAAGLSFRRPDAEIARWMRFIRLAALVVLVVQFAIWLIILMASPS